MVERPDAGLGDVAPGVQDPAVPLRRRVPRARRTTRTSPATSPSTSTASTCPRRSTSASTSPTSVPFGAADRGPRGPAQHHADGRAVHRRLDAGRGGRRAAPAVAHRAAPPPSTCSARRRSSAPRPTATQARVARAPRRARARRRRALGARRPPRARRPRPAARGSTSASSRPRWPPTTSRSAAATGSSRPRTRIRPILRLARDRGAHVHFDMEHYDAKDLTLALFRELLVRGRVRRRRGRHRRSRPTCRDSRDDLADLIAWSRGTAHADHGAAGQGRVLGHRDRARPGRGLAAAGLRAQGRDRRQLRALRPAAARPPRRGAGRLRLHNLRSLAYAVSYARHRGIPDHGYEIQMLYGMAEPVHAAVKRLGLRLRVYAPVGELVPGHGLPGAAAAREHVATRASCATASPRAARSTSWSRRPRSTRSPGPTEPPVVAADRSRPTRRRTSPSRCAEWRRASARAAFAVAVDTARDGAGLEVPALIDGERVRTAATIDVGRSRPARPRRRHVARRARRPTPTRRSPPRSRPRRAWRATPARERAGAAVPRRGLDARSAATSWPPSRCFEAGKPWDQADADVCEAIDFCEYYGREVLRLDGAPRPTGAVAARARRTG